MDGLRYNFLRNRWVIVSTVRAKRPVTINHTPYIQTENIDCPFCIGNEDLTEVIYTTKNNVLRVVKNLYPALYGDNGFHEVLIDTTEHGKRLEDNSVEDLTEILYGINDRIKYHLKNNNTKYVQVFKNEGKSSGATMAHSHMQLMALNFLPSKIIEISSNFQKYFKENNSCYICDLEENKDIFTFYENNNFKALTHYAALYEGAMEIHSKKHISTLDEANTEDLADVLKKALMVLKKSGVNAYNILFYSYNNDNFHFFIDIVPRMGSFAGFEISTDSYIISNDTKEVSEKFRKLVGDLC